MFIIFRNNNYEYIEFDEYCFIDHNFKKYFKMFSRINKTFLVFRVLRIYNFDSAIDYDFNKTNGIGHCISSYSSNYLDFNKYLNTCI